MSAFKIGRRALIWSSSIIIWAAYQPFIIRSGFQPGYIGHGYQPPYPLQEVLFVSALTAAETLAVVALLRPSTYHHSWRRALLALSLVIGACITEFLFTVTDMPGYFYVNTGYLLMLAVILAFLTMVSSQHSVNERNAT
jgi:hypothetical protein